MKTSELQGAALDWAVAQAEGNVRLQYDNREGLIINNVLGWIPYRPSVAWQQGGPIIEREGISVAADTTGMFEGFTWFATADDILVDPEDAVGVRGPTPLIAAMRCYVVSKLGDEVEVPDDLN